MIHAVLIVNNVGKPRLTKFYEPSPSHARLALVNQIYGLISSRTDAVCNFVDLPDGLKGLQANKRPVNSRSASSKFDEKGKGRAVDQTFGSENRQVKRKPDAIRVIYRHYATLYFAFVVDEAESELGILDLIQVFVESLDRCFENVCELDLIFHFDEIHLLLSCIIIGGLVMDTAIDSIASNFRAQMRARKESIDAGDITGLSAAKLKGPGSLVKSWSELSSFRLGFPTLGR